MIKPRITLTLAFTLLLGACAGLPGSKSATSEDLIEAAGIDHQLAALTKPIPAKNVEAPDFLLPGPVLGSANEAIASVVKPEAIHDALKADIEKTMSPEEITEALAFYHSPSGKAVVAAEGGQPGGNTEGNDPRAFAQLDTATGTSKMITSLTDQTLAATLDYANEHGCFGLDKNKFTGYLGGVVEKALLNAVREAIRDQLQRRYDSLPPDALDAYLRFAQSPSGGKFFAARNQAVSDNLQTLSAALSAALMEQVTQHCAQTSANP